MHKDWSLDLDKYVQYIHFIYLPIYVYVYVYIDEMYMHSVCTVVQYIIASCLLVLYLLLTYLHTY